VPQVRCSGCFGLASWSAIPIGPGDVNAGCLDLTGAVYRLVQGWALRWWSFYGFVFSND
jgi:hypothetical protein